MPFIADQLLIDDKSTMSTERKVRLEKLRQRGRLGPPDDSGPQATRDRQAHVTRSHRTIFFPPTPSETPGLETNTHTYCTLTPAGPLREVGSFRISRNQSPISIPPLAPYSQLEDRKRRRGVSEVTSILSALLHFSLLTTTWLVGTVGTVLGQLKNPIELRN